MAGLVARGLSMFEGYARRAEERKRRRLLPAHPGMADLVAAHSVEDLRRLGKELGLSKLAGRREAVEARVLKALRDVDRTRARLEALPGELREPLRKLRQSGGSMPYDDFTRTFDPPKKEPGSPSVLSRLEKLGVVLIGTIGGRPSVALPSELGPLL